MERNKKFKKRKRHSYDQEKPEILRVRLPKGKELLGIVDIRLGYGKSSVKCSDGKTRISRVPGALKRRLWVRPGDVVLIVPWDFEGDKKADILHCYKKNHAAWLRNNNYLKDLFEAEEF